MIDLHTHILPGMDDGSRSPEISLEMLRRQKKAGVKAVCLTSHYYARHNSISQFLERRDRHLYELLAAMGTEELPLVIPAAETAYFIGISECKDLPDLCIENTRTLMLEMPFSEWSNVIVEEVSSVILDRGLDVVLVHPERFCETRGNRDKIEKFCELGVSLQVNAETLIDWRQRKLGIELLESAPTALLGSDCHNLTNRAPNFGAGKDVVIKKLGRKFWDEMQHSARRLAGFRTISSV